MGFFSVFVLGNGRANQVKMFGLDAFKIGVIASAGVRPQRRRALGRAGAYRVGKYPAPGVPWARFFGHSINGFG